MPELTSGTRDLNVERPEWANYGLVVMFDDDAGPLAECTDAWVRWYRTKAELDAAWNAAWYCSNCGTNEPAIKRLDELNSQWYWIEWDAAGTAIRWEPK